MKKIFLILTILIIGCESQSNQEEKARKISITDSLIVLKDQKIVEINSKLDSVNINELKNAMNELKLARVTEDLAEIDSAFRTLNTALEQADMYIKINNRPTEMVGVWSAKWETPPESYPDLTDTEFYMNGEFTFTSDSLTIKNNGFPGCIFNIDTIEHTQSWYVSNDTLFLYNDPEVLGMSYLIKNITGEKIELQLMDDIFVSLSKASN